MMTVIDPRLTDINSNEIYHYLGIDGRYIRETEKKAITECIEDVKSVAKPLLVYKKAAVNDGCVDGLDLKGNDIRDLLKDCDGAIIFAATLGYDIDRLINILQIKDMAKAVIADACAGAAIENICDNFEKDMRKALEDEGCTLTERFSPGYGDLPLNVQNDLTDFLDCQRRIGIIVADNCLMTPIKSVTAIMGISPYAAKKDSCSDKDFRICISCTNNKDCTFCKKIKSACDD